MRDRWATVGAVHGADWHSHTTAHWPCIPQCFPQEDKSLRLSLMQEMPPAGDCSTLLQILQTIHRAAQPPQTQSRKGQPLYSLLGDPKIIPATLRYIQSTRRFDKYTDIAPPNERPTPKHSFPMTLHDHSHSRCRSTTPTRLSSRSPPIPLQGIDPSLCLPGQIPIHPSPSDMPPPFCYPDTLPCPSPP